MPAGPVHARPLQPPLDHQLLGALDAPTADGIAAGVTPGIGQHVPSLRQIAKALLHRRHRLGLLLSRGRGDQLPQGYPHLVRISIVQRLTLVGKPACEGRRTLAIDCLPSLGHVA